MGDLKPLRTLDAKPGVLLPVDAKDRRPEIGEQHSAERDRSYRRKFQNFETIERTHGTSLCFFIALQFQERTRAEYSDAISASVRPREERIWAVCSPKPGTAPFPANSGPGQPGISATGSDPTPANGRVW